MRKDPNEEEPSRIRKALVICILKLLKNLFHYFSKRTIIYWNRFGLIPLNLIKYMNKWHFTALIIEFNFEKRIQILSKYLHL
jgi:hypothetical protein